MLHPHSFQRRALSSLSDVSTPPSARIREDDNDNENENEVKRLLGVNEDEKREEKDNMRER